MQAVPVQTHPCGPEHVVEKPFVSIPRQSVTLKQPAAEQERTRITPVKMHEVRRAKRMEWVPEKGSVRRTDETRPDSTQTTFECAKMAATNSPSTGRT